MSLTLEQRRDINRENARKSTGPKTAQGKANSRKNAIKHGLRSEVLALPHEDPAVISERATSWIDYYQPQSPAAQHLVNECVQATILSDRTTRYHHFALSGQIRKAGKAWLAEREDEVKKLKDLMNDDPAEAIRLLKRSGHGVCSLMVEWDGFQKRFVAEGCLNGTDCDHAISLLGCRPALDDMIHHPTAYLLCLFNTLAEQMPSNDCLKALCDPKNVPPSLHSKINAISHRPPEECRIWIRNLIKQELATLQKLADSLENIETLDYVEAEDRALILHDEAASRLFLRYHAESRNAFHRAFNKLEKTLVSDAARESCLEIEAPSEPKRRVCAEVEPEAPNEPDPRDSPDIDVEEESDSPNEANLDVREPNSDEGIIGRLKPVVMSLLLILLLFSARFASATTYPNEADPDPDGTIIEEVAAPVSNGSGRVIPSAFGEWCVRQTHFFTHDDD